MAAMINLGDGYLYAIARSARAALEDMRLFGPAAGVRIPADVTTDALELVSIDGVAVWRFQIPR